MRKEFEMPAIMVSKFNAENIVTASGVAAAKQALADAGVNVDGVTSVTFASILDFNN